MIELNHLSQFGRNHITTLKDVKFKHQTQEMELNTQ